MEKDKNEIYKKKHTKKLELLIYSKREQTDFLISWFLWFPLISIDFFDFWWFLLVEISFLNWSKVDRNHWRMLEIDKNYKKSQKMKSIQYDIENYQKWKKSMKSLEINGNQFFNFNLIKSDFLVVFNDFDWFPVISICF